MKTKILESLKKMNEYLSTASSKELSEKYSRLQMEPKIVRSYAKLETEVLSCYIDVKFETQTNSFDSEESTYKLAA